MPYDPRQIVNTAASFFLAADRSLEQRSLGPGQFVMLLVPAIVCRALSIELYFKAIVTLEGGSTTGHKLDALYAQLSPNSQTAIRTRTSLTEAELHQKLGGVTKAFIEWRYIFEIHSANIDPTFLYNIAYAAKVEAETLLAKEAAFDAPQGSGMSSG